MENFYNTAIEEQETVIIIDYFESKLKVYTSRKSIYKKICRKIGEPNETYYTNGKISGAKWDIPFSDKKTISAVLSRPTLIANIK